MWLRKTWKTGLARSDGGSLWRPEKRNRITGFISGSTCNGSHTTYHRLLTRLLDMTLEITDEITRYDTRDY